MKLPNIQPIIKYILIKILLLTIKEEKKEVIRSLEVKGYISKNRGTLKYLWGNTELLNDN